MRHCPKRKDALYELLALHFIEVVYRRRSITQSMWEYNVAI
nr:hypothetical protein Itr_chr14CG18370 [Ipomoea trifida]